MSQNLLFIDTACWVLQNLVHHLALHPAAKTMATFKTEGHFPGQSWILKNIWPNIIIKDNNWLINSKKFNIQKIKNKIMYNISKIFSDEQGWLKLTSIEMLWHKLVTAFDSLLMVKEKISCYIMLIVHIKLSKLILSKSLPSKSKMIAGDIPKSTGMSLGDQPWAAKEKWTTWRQSSDVGKPQC